ncbi:MAG: hypothetical protein ACT6U0_27335 [Shinella sp.]|uniref:hypothetical protein n=1 Tax=Shinella sp. TaxID=1870904 RepID=UPI004036AD39
MDGWLKGLIATACVVVIAIGGYFAVSEYRKSTAEAARKERLDGARKELFDLANAQPNEEEKVREFCKNLKVRIATDLQNNEMAPVLMRNCRAFGYTF